MSTALRAAAAASTLALLSFGLAGCDNKQTMLVTHGIGASEVLRLFWIFFAVSLLVWVAVVGAMMWAVHHRRASVDARDPLQLPPEAEGRARVVVSTLVGATGAILIALTLFSYLTGKSLAGLTGTETVTVRLTGYQWWWRVLYEDGDPSRTFYTANEIHIPVGETVKIKLDAQDVIHSFWVPSLAGKEDLIPGRAGEITIRADNPGIYRAQCAEFCGYQHSHMALPVVAELRTDWEAWQARQIAAAAPPQDGERQTGEAVFFAKGCAMCHAVRGTEAGSRVGPDLTHVGSRQTIAAGTLPMSPENLRAWIDDPQAIKPGSKMPRTDLTAIELRDVTSYVAGLK